VIASWNASGQPIIADLAASPSGRAAFTFGYLNGSRFGGSYARVYDPSVGWSAVSPFPAATRSFFAGVVYSGEDALFSYPLPNGTLGSCQMQRLAPATGWSAPERVDDLNANITACSVVPDRAGNLTAVMSVKPTTTNRDLYVRHFTPGGGWEPTLTLDTSSQNTTVNPAMADGKGDFLVTWMLGAGKANEVWSVRYLADLGWQAPVRVAPSNTFLNYTAPGAAASGNATVTWVETGAPYQIRYADLTVDDEAPPLTVDRPSTFVNTTTVLFAGQAEPLARVWVDGVAASVNSTGAFTVSLPYAEGDHTALVSAADREGNANSSSVTFTVDLSVTLSVFYPTDGLLVTVNLIPVHGAAEAGAAVTVNGVPVATDPAGTFTAEVVLAAGDNAIRVEAVDRAENHAVIAMTVQYFDAIGPLSAQIANLTAAVEALRANSSGSSQSLDAALQALGAATAQLAAANASLAAAELNLTIAQTRLADAERERDAANARAQTAAASGGGGALDLLLALASVAGIVLGLLAMMTARRTTASAEASPAKSSDRPPP